MQRIYNRAQVLALGPVHNALLELPGLSLLNVMPDLMHVKYLGSDKYVLGSIMYLLVYMILPGIRWRELHFLCVVPCGVCRVYG